MDNPQPKNRPRRVLIASVNPLFGKGLRKLLQEKWGHQVEIVGLMSSMADTITAMDDLEPDLVVLDYDDKTINREEFLSHFMAGDRTMQAMLVSLKSSGAVVVYDRKSLSSSEAEDWLYLPWLSDNK
jgi:cytochrome c oxidase subunit 2